MALFFKKEVPKACPKCGEKDLWQCVPAEPPESESAAASAVNPFSPAPIRGSFGQNLTGMKGRSKKLRCRCGRCGYTKNI